jgi:hypothetical protein
VITKGGINPIIKMKKKRTGCICPRNKNNNNVKYIPSQNTSELMGAGILSCSKKSSEVEKILKDLKEE